MNFPVPWRCLLPQEAVDFVTYNNHQILADLSNRTGAMIDVSGQRDTPKRLSDRIITISGQAEQKEGACLGIVEKLRKLQDLLDSEIGFFVIIVPATAIPVIVGIKGATIAEVLAGTGVEISIGKENVMGMPDTPIGLEGTATQVTTAVANIHKVIQDMADRGRLLPADFKYRPDKAAAQLAAGAGAHLPEVSLPPADHDLFYGMDPTQNFRTKAKIVVDTGLAGWLIGKGGRTIREMQENSGAFLHVIREDEPTPLLKPGERLIEICGRLERKLEGIQVVLRTADSMPGNAPRDTRILVPEVLASPLIMDQVASAYNSCVVERIPGSADGEAMLLVAGPITSRIQAIQEFMSKTDRAHMEGIVVAKSVDGEIVGKDGRPRREIREGLGYAPSNPPPPREPSPWLLRDPQEGHGQQQVPSEARFGAQPEHPQSESHASFSEVQSYQAWQKADAWPASPENSISSMPSMPSRPSRPSRFNQEDEMVNGYRPHRMEEVIDWQSPERNGRNGRAFESTNESREWERQPAIFHEQPEAVHEIPTEDPWLQEENFSKRQDWNSHDPIEPQRQPGKFLEQLPDPAEPERRMPTLPRKTTGYEQALQALASATEAAPRVEAMLLSSASTGSQRAELSVILGIEVLFQSLVPSGYLQDLSRRCQVHIDITADDSLPASLRQVILSGSAAANAAAAYWLQVGVLRHMVI